MTAFTNTTRVIPLEEAKELARVLTYESAAAALETFAAAIARKTLGSGCEKTERGAVAMRKRVVEVAREMARGWRAEAAGQGLGLPAQDAAGQVTAGSAP